MFRRYDVARLFALALLLALLPAAQAAAQKGGKKEKKEAPQGVPVLWSEHADVSGLDLFLGPGGEQMRPDLSRVTFVKKEEGGFSTKYRVKDAGGRVWVAKLGKEAQSETAATRLVWAAGYPVEITYLAPCVRIEGAPAPGKDVACEGGGFANVRFEARPDDFRRLDMWKWDENPFVGTRELQGLKVLMALIENWDTKDDNNKVIYVPGGASGRGELRYVVSDLGATFGASDGPSGPVSFFKKIKGSRNEPAEYARDKFVEGVESGYVRLEFGGKNARMMKNITAEQARWVGSLLARLSDRQLEDAFRAANYGADDVRLLAGAVRARIDQLTGLGTAEAGRR